MFVLPRAIVVCLVEGNPQSLQNLPDYQLTGLEQVLIRQAV